MRSTGAALRLRIKSKGVLVEDIGLANLLRRLLLSSIWFGGIAILALYHYMPPQVVCWTPLVLLFSTAWILDRGHGRAIAGAEAAGARGVLTFDGELVQVKAGKQTWRFGREDILAGWTEALADREDVVLATRSGIVARVALPSDEEGRDVLRAIGVAPEQRAVELRLGITEPGMARGLMIFFALVLGLIIVLTLPVIGVGILEASHRPVSSLGFPLFVVGFEVIASVAWFRFLVRPLLTTTVRIGTDSVVIRRLFQRRRLVRRAVLHHVYADGDTVVLLPRSGEATKLPTSGPAEASVVVARIREAMAEASFAPARAALLEKLDRRGRPLAVWLHDLRGMVKEAAAYREASVDRKDLLDVVRDGGATGERRIAAAAALSAEADAEVRAGLRVAVEACADDRLRVALERAAKGELEAAAVEEIAAAEEIEEARRGER